MHHARQEGQDVGRGADGGRRYAGAADPRPPKAGEPRVRRHLAVHALPQAAAEAPGRAAGVVGETLGPLQVHGAFVLVRKEQDNLHREWV